MKRILVVLMMGAWSAGAMADAVPYATDAQVADWASRRNEAAGMQQEAKRQKAEAAQRYDEEERQCYERFLVNRCRDEAHGREIEALRAARKLDSDARAKAREVLKEELAAKDAYRLKHPAAKAKDAEARAATDPAEKAALQKAANAERPDKQAKAEEAARRNAEDEANRKAAGKAPRSAPEGARQP